MFKKLLEKKSAKKKGTESRQGERFYPIHWHQKMSSRSRPSPFPSTPSSTCNSLRLRRSDRRRKRGRLRPLRLQGIRPPGSARPRRPGRGLVVRRGDAPARGGAQARRLRRRERRRGLLFFFGGRCSLLFLLDFIVLSRLPRGLREGRHAHRGEASENRRRPKPTTPPTPRPSPRSARPTRPCERPSSPFSACRRWRVLRERTRGLPCAAFPRLGAAPRWRAGRRGRRPGGKRSWRRGGEI